MIQKDKVTNSKLRFFRDKSGVSLIIAVIFTAVFLLVMASLYESIYRSISARRNWDIDDKTRYLTESTIELASLFASTHGIGENTSDLTATDPRALQSSLQLLIDWAVDVGFTNCADMDGATGTFDPCVNFEVVGRGTGSDKVNLNSDDYFSIPIKGTGNAAERCTVADTDEDSANDPCHWNKLYIGESVDIPLYHETAAGVVTTDATGGRPAWKLRVRSPLCGDVTVPAGDSWSCDGGALGTGRIILYPQPSGAASAPYRDIDKDPVLMQWLIRNAEGNQSLIASDKMSEVEGEEKLRPDPYYAALSILNTELSAGRFNGALTAGGGLQDFIVLENTYKAENEAGDEVTINAVNALPSFTKPILHLDLVGQPRWDDDGIPATPMGSASINNSQYKIPYLEYQLLVDSDSPIVSDSKTVLLGKVSIAGFNREVKKYKQGTTTLSGFALESF